MANEGSDIDEVNYALDGVGEEEEDENAAQEEDDNDMEEDEEEYTFRFKTGMNPLDFVDDNDDSGIQPYQRFVRLEREALADKKRKAPEQCHSEEPPSKMAREGDISGAKIAEIMEAMDYYGMRKRSRKPKKRGRRKGSKNRVDPKLTQMQGDATFHYACGDYDRAKAVLCEVIRLAPNLHESYHTLGLVYTSLQDYKRAMALYLIAAHLDPKESPLWKTIFTWSIEQGYVDQAGYCLLKAIKADPKDVTLRFHLARLYAELGHYQKAAVTYEQVHKLCCENIDALKAAAKFYKKCGQVEYSIQILEDYIKSQPDGANVSVVDLLGTVLMETKAHDRALQHIEHAQTVNARKELPLNLKIKAGICHAHLGNMERAQALFNDLKPENASKHIDLVTKVADSLMGLEHYNPALNYYLMLEGNIEKENDDVDARITLASLLLEEAKEDEAISLLSPPKDSDFGEAPSEKSNRWWADIRIKLKLCNIYWNRGTLDDFVDTIFPLVRESLLKASRAKKLLQKKAMEKEKRKAEALASGIDWLSDDSDDEPQKENREPPLCNLLKDEEHHQLIIDLCKALASLQRYWEALEIINLSLRLAHTSLSTEKKEELRSLGAQMAYNTTDPKHGFDCVKYIVQQHPHGVAAWNCYYKVISRLENRDTRHYKFVRGMQGKFVDCVPPILISGHQFTICSHHQDAARKYLEAYKLLPENPLVNLCVGTALINLALGFRLQNKHQCVVQGLAFLYNNMRICENSQESLYNIARAFHHVGLVTLAAFYYEKVIAICEKDYPIPKLPNENPDSIETHKPGYCDLRREAAYNLHLIYKKSGALDLARQVLKDHCTLTRAPPSLSPKLEGVKELAQLLVTDLKRGISDNKDDIDHRKRVFGVNLFTKPPSKRFLSFVLESFNDTTIIILLVCALLSFSFLWDQATRLEGGMFRKLSAKSNHIGVEVVRGGRRQSMSTFDVVVGDIVCLKIGDQVSADGVFLEGHSLKANESSMKGESEHVHTGTKVTDGFARMLVTSVGMNTAWGAMMGSMTKEIDEETPLQVRLNKLTSAICKVGLSVAALVFGVSMARYFSGCTRDEFGNREFVRRRTESDDVVNAVVGIVVAAVRIVVVAIPEGLPLAVTMTLAAAVSTGRVLLR
ncbi:putative calcium-transporting ATPase 13, plasma membrane-type [Glycine soja]